MFVKKVFEIGKSRCLSIHNEDYSYGIEIIPSSGALVNSLIIGGKNIIEGLNNEEEIHQNDAFKSTFLAPFPNRIKDGSYAFNGTIYQLPINEKPRNNALHGLIFKAPFEIVGENISESGFEITLKYDYKGDNAGYPFPFTSELKMSLGIEAGFSCQMTFTNNSDKIIPFGYGWHPYFQLGENVDKWHLQFPTARKFEVDNQLIPTGKHQVNTQFTSPHSLEDVDLDGCFELIEKGEVVKTHLKNENGFGITLWQETGDKKLNFLQIYIPPHRKSIAIEPQTSCVDAFNNGIGLFKLAAAESIHASFGIELLS